MGLGKPRSKFGRWLDSERISQEELVRISGVNKSTISRLCSGDAFKPSMKSALKIISALRRVGKNVDYEDFWSI
ncbi:helix-turn-helix transcriptional regulator [Brevibacillus fulvus]|uniref:Transcriptional regulator with XRE-family HTH domain n=1 Tax=Brevibacillus fulvus TaxID=1125967 RepID=A0A939BR26_9BACL|nr:helix-turn-helix transcriptional regulator [Brevibacillus fulvus]MBM7592230.1 transcriptional regulator with XRE-family HTH domain [Brevibacillus fulvus]